MASSIALVELLFHAEIVQADSLNVLREGAACLARSSRNHRSSVDDQIDPGDERRFFGSQVGGRSSDVLGPPLPGDQLDFHGQVAEWPVHQGRQSRSIDRARAYGVDAYVERRQF